MASAAPSVSATGAGQPWSCQSCGRAAGQGISVLSKASVACPGCGVFGAPVRPAGTAAAAVSTGVATPLPTAAVKPASSSAVPSVSIPTPLALDDESTVERFKQLLRMRTVANEGTTNGANEEAVAFLKRIGESFGLKSQVLEFKEHRPILILTLQGSDPTLPSVLLNSHYDVVPVMQANWDRDAFAAEEQDGKIFARGTQDMKSVCMQYIESLMRLVRQSDARQFVRTLHLSYMPDEETGGEWGMQKWTESPEFRALNIGFALDEGIANPADEYTVFYGERGVWWMTLKAVGPTGHASRFIQNPATSKLMRSVQHFLDYRDVQEAKLLGGHSGHSGECGHAVSKKLELGDVITLNLTVLQAGVSVDGGKTHSMNVVPMEATAGFDLRLPPHVDLAEFEALVKQWTKEDGLSYTVRKFSAEEVTQLDEQRNPFWAAFKHTLEAGSVKVAPQIFPAGTDSRFLRRAGIPALGFSPLRKTPVLLHDHNEFVTRSTFLEGIQVYERLIPALANMVEPMKNEDGVYPQPKQPLDVVQPRPAPAAAAASASSSSSALVASSSALAAPSSSPFDAVLDAKFPGAIDLNEFVFQTKMALVPLGFYPQVNTMAVCGLCRDEITSPFEEEIESVWGQAFICGSLAGMLFCGDTGFSAAHHHQPPNGHFVYYCFTHIAIDHEGHIGSVYRTRSGMSEKTTACGALAAFTGEIAAGNLDLQLNESDLEQSMLKKHVCATVPSLSQDPASPPDLLTVTRAAFQTLTADLERHVAHDAAKFPLRQYALFSGVQVHGPDGADYAWLGKSSLMIGGTLRELPFVKASQEVWAEMQMPSAQQLAKENALHVAASSVAASVSAPSKSVVVASSAALAAVAPSTPFGGALDKAFPGALGVDEFVFQTKTLLVPFGFFPQVNTMSVVGLCRDEITSQFEEKIESVWGQAFICGSLAGMLFCGDTGFSAAHHHQPPNGHFVYYCFTHIAIDHEGHIGSVYRTRSGMSEKTTACGALAAFTGEIAAGKLDLQLNESDLEQSMLKKHVCATVPSLSQDPASPPDLLTVTRAAFQTLTADLERHVAHDAAKFPLRQYALFSGVQVHGPDGADYAWLGKSSLMIGGTLRELPFVKASQEVWAEMQMPSAQQLAKENALHVAH